MCFVFLLIFSYSVLLFLEEGVIGRGKHAQSVCTFIHSIYIPIVYISVCLAGMLEKGKKKRERKCYALCWLGWLGWLGFIIVGWRDQTRPSLCSIILARQRERQARERERKALYKRNNSTTSTHLYLPSPTTIQPRDSGKKKNNNQKSNNKK